MGLASSEFKLGNTGIWCALLSIGDETAVVVHFPVDEIVVRPRWW